MPEINGPTVYVLGAGASVHTGAPLLNDFLVTARHLYQAKADLLHRESFGRVFDWINSLRASAYYVDVDTDNLEHVFSILEMSRQIGLEGAAELSDDLVQLVVETLDRQQLVFRGGKLVPEPVYQQFATQLLASNRRRKEVTKADAFGGNDSIITFNYDVMVDCALAYAGYTINYHVAAPPKPNGIDLLKLHGSVNWGISKCSDEPTITVVPPPLGDANNPLMQEGVGVPIRMATHSLPRARCNHCGNACGLRPLLVPPTWSKAINRWRAVADVWAQAVRNIESAQQIVVIGYSMPETDTFFKYLLSLGLKANRGLHRVVVVNPSATPALRTRYESVFSRSMKDRGRLVFEDGAGGFQAFVGPAMERIAQLR